MPIADIKARWPQGQFTYSPASPEELAIIGVDLLVRDLGVESALAFMERYSRNTRQAVGTRAPQAGACGGDAYFRRARRSVSRSKKPWALPFSTQNTFLGCFRPSYQSTMVWPKVGPSRLSTTMLA